MEKKAKKEKEEIIIPLEDLSPIAQPLAQKKLLKKLHKTIKKGRHLFSQTYSLSLILVSYSLKAATCEARREGSSQGYPQGREGVS